MKYQIALIGLLLGLFITPRCEAQSTDLMRLEYTFIPQKNSVTSFTRTRAFINFPIPLGWEGSYLIPGIEFRNVNLDTEGILPA